MPYPLWQPGMRITAERLAAQQWQEIIQGTTTTINNSTTMVDTNIVVPLAAGARYFYELMVAYTSADDADIVFDWAAQADQTVTRVTTWGIGAGATGDIHSMSGYTTRSPAMGTDVQAGGAGVSAFVGYNERGSLNGGSADGTVTFRAAQRVAQSSDTVIQANTRCRFLRVE